MSSIVKIFQRTKFALSRASILLLCLLTGCPTARVITVDRNLVKPDNQAEIEFVIPEAFKDYFGLSFSAYVKANLFHARSGCPDVRNYGKRAPGRLGKAIMTRSVTKQKVTVPAGEPIYGMIEFTEHGLNHAGFCANGFRFIPEKDAHYRFAYDMTLEYGLKNCNTVVTKLESDQTYRPLTADEITFAVGKGTIGADPTFADNLCADSTQQKGSGSNN